MLKQIMHLDPQAYTLDRATYKSSNQRLLDSVHISWSDGNIKSQDRAHLMKLSVDRKKRFRDSLMQFYQNVRP
jgi:hypothetical protein